ncbi:hypothetical protein [Alienimonas sp. DA493]|uniref:hypothetical protein n=1 Tax=Alienimonas sp. DA493 TaxID=3373605 RepID=UPI0037544D30
MQSLTNQSAFAGTLSGGASATEVYLSPAAGSGGSEVKVKVRLSNVTAGTEVSYAASVVSGGTTYPLPTAAGSATISGTVGSIQFGPAYLESGEQLKITLDNPGASAITVVSSSRDLASVTTDDASRTASQATGFSTHSAADVVSTFRTALFGAATFENRINTLPSSGTVSSHDADAAGAAAATAILATPANKLATNASGHISRVETVDSVTALAANAIIADALSTAAVAKIEAALINEGDGQTLIDAIVQAIDAADIENDVLPSLIRDAILNRVLAGNHDAAGTLGKLLQSLPGSGTVNTVTPLDSTATQAAAAAALTAYDPPTKAELDTAVGAVTVAGYAAGQAPLLAGVGYVWTNAVSGEAETVTVTEAP